MGKEKRSPWTRPWIRENLGSAGFTLVELLVITVFIGILAVLSFPALQTLIVRSKLDGMSRQTAALLQKARSEALKRNEFAVVEADVGGGTLIAFLDTDDNQKFDVGLDEELATLSVPRHISFSAPATEVPPDPVVGFTAGVAVFELNGSIRDTGAFRFGDPRGNYLEVRVAPARTARIQIRKYLPDLVNSRDGTKWFARGDDENPWQWY